MTATNRSEAVGGEHAHAAECPTNRWSAQISVLIVALVTAIAATLAATTARADDPIDSTGTCCARAVRIDPPPPPARDSVAIIGDSLTLGVTSAAVLGTGNTIQDRLRAQGRDVTVVSSRKGRTTGEGIVVVNSNAAAIERADVVLLGLGTNNIWGRVGNSRETARAEIERVTGAVLAIDPDTIVMWVDLSIESVGQRTRNFNDALDDVAAALSSVEVCEWRDSAVATPGTFASDGIHLTGSGYRARRDILLNCLST